MKLKLQSGQSFFEVLVAIAVISGVLVSLIGYVATSLNNNTFAKNSSSATRFSQEAIEWLRGERDADWIQFKTYAASSAIYCLSDSPPISPASWSIRGNCSALQTIPGTIFRREGSFTCYVNPPTIISCANASVTTIQAQVTTYFTDGKGRHNYTDTTYFTNWK